MKRIIITSIKFLLIICLAIIHQLWLGIKYFFQTLLACIGIMFVATGCGSLLSIGAFYDGNTLLGVIFLILFIVSLVMKEIFWDYAK